MSDHEDIQTGSDPVDPAEYRQQSPSAGRNKDAIADVLAKLLPDSARVLEIASGSGEHGLAVVTKRPDLNWQPSDQDLNARMSINAWRIEAEDRIEPALELDVTEASWEQDLGPFNAVFCANMIHIAPWAAAQGLFRGASELLDGSGLLILYGPFMEGDRTAPSNLDFDASLKSRNPEWGVRDLGAVDTLARQNGFTRSERIQMPANNLILVFTPGAV